MYKLNKSLRTGEINSVILIGEGYQLGIPFDPDNTDYQAYLKFIADGGQPLPADTPEGATE